MSLQWAEPPDCAAQHSTQNCQAGTDTDGSLSCHSDIRGVTQMTWQQQVGTINIWHLRVTGPRDKS